MTRPFAALCLIGTALLSGCAMAQPGNPSAPTRVQTAPAQAAAAQPVDTEVPAELLDRMRAELAKEQGVSAADVKVISAQAVSWPNGALGCPKPGVMYTQAIVPGYRVELEASGRRFTYHASTRGALKRCDSRVPGLPPPATR
jgi:hypothetical protein